MVGNDFRLHRRMRGTVWRVVVEGLGKVDQFHLEEGLNRKS
jgi:hypothetical protein